MKMDCIVFFFEKFEKKYVTNSVASELVTAVINDEVQAINQFFDDTLKMSGIGPAGCIIALYHAYEQKHDHIEKFFANNPKVQLSLCSEPVIGISLLFILAIKYYITDVINTFFTKPNLLQNVQPFCFGVALTIALEKNRDKLAAALLAQPTIRLALQPKIN